MSHNARHDSILQAPARGTQKFVVLFKAAGVKADVRCVWKLELEQCLKLKSLRRSAGGTLAPAYR